MRTLLNLIGTCLSLAAVSGDGRAAEPSQPAPQVMLVAQALTPAGEGRRAYMKYNCYGCHGANATGGIAMNIVGKDSGDVAEAVLEGKDKGMPSYQGIVSPKEITNLGAYLRSIGTAGEPKFNDWWVPVPTK